MASQTTVLLLFCLIVLASARWVYVEDEPSDAFAKREFKREPASCGAVGASCGNNKDCCYPSMCYGPRGGPNNQCATFGY